MADTPETSSSKSLYEVAIGEKNQTYYLDRFEQFDEKGDEFHISWNWAAFFFSGFWAFYRKMYGWFFAMWAFATIINMAEKLNAPPAVGLLYLAPGLYFAIFGNSLYHRKVKAQIASAQKSNIDESRVIKRLNGISGVHTWVLYVFGAIPLLGVVASIAIPAYQDYSKGQATAVQGYVPFTGQLDGERATTDAIAQFKRGMNYLTGEGVTQDYVEAVRWFRLAAAQGNAIAQYNLGVSYENGLGVPKDYVEAVRWYRLAAAQGNASAQYNLGGSYEKGQGVPKDYVEAVRWYRLATAQGDAYAQSSLAMMYDTGQGVAQDYAEAVKWYRLAAAQGNAIAQHNLAVMYYIGQGVAQDYAEAVKWYRLAAAQGIAPAQTSLGLMYALGQGVAKDVTRAHLWLNLGAVDGTPEKVNRRDAIAKKMTPQQIAQAQQMARDCQQRNFKGCD